jgi:hypothetical protein
VAITTAGRAVTKRTGVAVVVGLVVLGLPSLVAGSGAAAPAPSTAHSVLANVGPGYSVTSQGPLGSGQIASSAPNPTAAAAALTQLSHAGAISTYERVWEDAGQNNAVQDLVVRFSTSKEAQIFDASVVSALTNSEVVHSGPLAAIPDAFRTTYFAVTNKVGVGQAIAMRSGHYVAVLSFFSSSSVSNTGPISPNDAVRIAEAQHALISTSSTSHPATKKSSGTSPFLVVGVIILIALIFFLLARRWFVRSLASSAGSTTEASPDHAAPASKAESSPSTDTADTAAEPAPPSLPPSTPAHPSAAEAVRSPSEQSGIWSQSD